MSLNMNQSNFSDNEYLRVDAGQEHGRFDDRTGLSTNVEVSHRGSQGARGGARRSDGERIDEASNETGRSSPPGTIGEHHEYMSENIESNVIVKQTRKSYSKGYENQSTMSVKEGQAISNIARNGNGQYVQTEKESSFDACSHIAVVRQKIPLPNDDKHIHGFKSTYDRLFAEFQEKLLYEYRMMKEIYIEGYTQNYNINCNEKQNNIEEFLATINDKKQQGFDLDKMKQQNLSQMERFFLMKNRMFYFRVCVKYWRTYIKRRLEKNRKAAYTRNTIYRNRLTRIFRGWRTCSHSWGIERINNSEDTFRKELERQKLTMWTSKVDQLMLYMAQMEDKIKSEVKAREMLSFTYEQSLNKGVSKLNNETQILAENPLVQEISLIVAKQLLTKSQKDPNAIDELLTIQQRQQITDLKNQLSFANSQQQQQMQMQYQQQ